MIATSAPWWRDYTRESAGRDAMAGSPRCRHRPWIAGLTDIEMHMLTGWGYKPDLRIFPTADDALRTYAAEQDR